MEEAVRSGSKEVSRYEMARDGVLDYIFLHPKGQMSAVNGMIIGQITQKTFLGMKPLRTFAFNWEYARAY